MTSSVSIPFLESRSFRVGNYYTDIDPLVSNPRTFVLSMLPSFRPLVSVEPRRTAVLPSASSSASSPMKLRSLPDTAKDPPDEKAIRKGAYRQEDEKGGIREGTYTWEDEEGNRVHDKGQTTWVLNDAPWVKVPEEPDPQMKTELEDRIIFLRIQLGNALSTDTMCYGIQS